MSLLTQLSFCLLLLLSLSAIDISFASRTHTLYKVLTFKEAIGQARASCGLDARAFHLYGESTLEGYKKSDLSGLIADETHVNCLAATLCEHKNESASAEKHWYRASSFCKTAKGPELSATITSEITGEEDSIGESETNMEESNFLQAPQSEALILSTSEIKTFIFGFVLGGSVFFALFKGREHLGLQPTSTVLRRRPEL